MLETAHVVDDFINNVLENPCFGFVAGLNEAGHPEISRFFGFNFDLEQFTLAVYTFKKDFQKLRDHLTAGEKIAITLSNGQNFETIQFKGTLNRIYDTPEREMNFPRLCNKRQADIIAGWGISNDVFANWKFEESVTVVMDVHEIYDQTPKPNTGEKIL